MSNAENRNVTILPDMRIPLSDGVYLSARVWMPDGADMAPLPAVLEYLPYRKSDGTAARDHAMHAYFARNGYVCLRVDRRGCGDSQGLFDDEYSPQELADGVEVINWIAAQPWCDGKVGIQGISWGGFNGLQIAALAPEPLRAVITIGSTVDRYADDIHYKGGIQLGENIGWAATLMSWLSMPPDPALVGEGWRDIWLERLKNTPFLAQSWVGHADRGAYWKHGSVCEDYAAIKAPVLALGGLHDGYRNTMSHLVKNLSAPVRGMAGPWSHKYPHISTVGPSIDYLNLALSWWDRWLKGVENGVDKGPAYSAYVMDHIEPDASLNFRPGHWIGETSWPSPDIQTEQLWFGDGTMGKAAPFQTRITTDMACGRNCGEYFPFGFGPGELPDEQSHDDALSACFDSAPMTQDWQIVGAPKVRLRLSSDRPRAQIIVRLCDLAPDGSSAFISLGLLNLRHRDGFDKSVDLLPGQEHDVSVLLDQTAYRLPKGHRLRVAVSTSYWPYCWPEGEAFALTLIAGEVEIPRHQAGPQTATPVFDPPIKLAVRPYRSLGAPSEEKTREQDPKTGQITLRLSGDHGRMEDLETGLITHSDMSETWVIDRDNPASAFVEIIWNRSLGRDGEQDGFQVRSRVVTRMWGRMDHFRIEQLLQAWDGSDLVFEKTMKDNIDR